jgi:hypothetical protein
MSIYAQNIGDVEAVPVPSANIKRKATTEPVLPTPDGTEKSPSGSIVDEGETPVNEEPIEKVIDEKKIAQKAARAAKAKATREAKKAAAAEPVVIAPKPKSTPVKKSYDDAPIKPKKRKTTTPVQLPVVDDTVPPAWFKAHLAKTRVEEAKIAEPKKAARTVRKEADEEATVKWRQPETQTLISQHEQAQLNQMRKQQADMDKMYAQMFRR